VTVTGSDTWSIQPLLHCCQHCNNGLFVTE